MKTKLAGLAIEWQEKQVFCTALSDGAGARRSLPRVVSADRL
ncbi:MAG: hypothetical protein RMY36_025785 [Nostoc sp. SerVER01]|nr:hypothetical protein [Nostoc sp. SerVER01]MDZ8025360.1 hypothetical protein [Nostoc sp. DedQUE11]MDZ8075235.1 hypothetical protein [Nostoc sp. DedQUE01]MDZ8082260.1 hypothetical protein [Nostoc sp. DcaGUA01]